MCSNILPFPPSDERSRCSSKHASRQVIGPAQDEYEEHGQRHHHGTQCKVSLAKKHDFKFFSLLQYDASRKVMPIVPPKPEPINPMVALGLGKIKKKPVKPPPKQTLEEAIAALSGDKTEEEGGKLSR